MDGRCGHRRGESVRACPASVAITGKSGYRPHMTQTPIHIDEAQAYLINALVAHPVPRGGHVNHSQRPYGCDIWVQSVAEQYYTDHHRLNLRDLNDETLYIPFYDAAWELARIGVLRPQEVAPRGMAMGSGFHGDGYSLTAYGHAWIKAAASRTEAPASPDRYIAAITAFSSLFGPAFISRASEAVHCWRTNNYLAACVMAGAAAESVLLAVAIGKTSDEAEVLKSYRASGGRKKVADLVTGKISTRLREDFLAGLSVLSYWRDEAGHGAVTNISEPEAFIALTQLLRLSQLTADNWAALTKT